MEVASRTRFTQHFTHLKAGEPAKDLEPILVAILTDGRNLGLFKRGRRLGRLVSIPVPARPP